MTLNAWDPLPEAVLLVDDVYGPLLAQCETRSETLEILAQRAEAQAAAWRGCGQPDAAFARDRAAEQLRSRISR